MKLPLGPARPQHHPPAPFLRCAHHCNGIMRPAVSGGHARPSWPYMREIKQRPREERERERERETETEDKKPRG